MITRWLTLAALMFFVASCTTAAPVKSEAPKAPVNVANDFNVVRRGYDLKQPKKSVPLLKKFLHKHPDSEFTDDANFMLANLYFDQLQFVEAYNAYSAVVNSPHATPHETASRLQSVRCLLRLQKLPEAEAALKPLVENKGLSLEHKIEAQKLRLEALTAQKKHFISLEPIVFLMDQATNPLEKERYRVLGQDVVETQLNHDEIKTVADSRSYSLLQTPAKYRYGLIMAERKEYSRSRRYLEDVVRETPDSELGEKSSQLIRQIDSRNNVDSRTIGVVLPLSGKQAAVGYKALRGIQLGLGVYGKSPSQFRLAVIDSESNPDVSRRAVERLVTEDHVIAIVGGLLSKTATAEAAKAQEYGVPFVALSQKAGITQIGNEIFRNALTSQMQVKHIVDIAMNQLKMTRFAILYPNDAYGVEYANLFWDEVRARGGSIRGAQPYPPEETDFRGYLQRLVGTFYLEDRSEEYRARMRVFHEKNPKRSARAANPSIEDILPPIVDFDAIFIPDSAKAAGQIAPTLAYTNIKDVRLLGTNLWNSPSLPQRGKNYVENVIFVDSFLTTDRSFQGSAFYDNFKTTFDEEPGIFELQAYDAALLLRQTIAGGESTRVGLTQRLGNLREFPGALGPLSMTADREIGRPLTALTVQDGKIVPLNSQQN